MKQVLMLIITLSLISSCKVMQDVPKDPLTGKWSLYNYEVYMAIDENTNLPAYKMGDVVWTFDTSKSSLQIKKKNPSDKNDFSLNEGTYSYTKNESKIKIANQEYLIQFNPDQGGVVAFDAQGQEVEKPKREVLVLDTNTDPNLSNDAPVLYFYKM